MPRFTVYTNQDLCHKGIQNSNLSAGVAQKIPTRRVEGKHRLSHLMVASMFDCSPALLAGALDEFRDQDGQADSVVVCDGMTRYLDDQAFYAAAVAFGWPDQAVMQVLTALGHVAQEVAV